MLLSMMPLDASTFDDLVEGAAQLGMPITHERARHLESMVHESAHAVLLGLKVGEGMGPAISARLDAMPAADRDSNEIDALAAEVAVFRSLGFITGTTVPGFLAAAARAMASATGQPEVEDLLVAVVMDESQGKARKTASEVIQALAAWHSNEGTECAWSAIPGDQLDFGRGNQGQDGQRRPVNDHRGGERQPPLVRTRVRSPAPAGRVGEARRAHAAQQQHERCATRRNSPYGGTISRPWWPDPVDVHGLVGLPDLRLHQRLHDPLLWSVDLARGSRPLRRGAQRVAPRGLHPTRRGTLTYAPPTNHHRLHHRNRPRPARGRPAERGLMARASGHPRRAVALLVDPVMTFVRTRALELLRAGWTIPSVAEAIAVSESTVKRWKRAAGMTKTYLPRGPAPIRTPHLGRNVTADTVLELWGDGLSNVAIADKLLIDRKTVAARLAELGLEPNGRTYA